MASEGKIITLVGCGAMGSALLQGWLNASDADEFWVVAPRQASVAAFQREDSRVSWFPSPEALPGPVSVLVIALKPFVLAEALPAYQACISNESLIISVATGKPLSFYQGHLGQPIIRAMPNTPVSVNQGVIGLVADKVVRSRWEARVTEVLGDLGYLSWVSTEDQLNQVTALSGSGPAYVFYMIEAMTQVGVNMGLPPDQAYQMALYTVAGAGAYALQAGLPASILRENVTSPKGTTEQALNILMAPEGLEDLMGRAIDAAFHRAKELAK